MTSDNLKQAGQMPNSGSSSNFGWIMGIYLLGLIVGGLYVGMVAPVRTVVQQEFGIGNAQGIWIITIYALFYASFIPIIGKLADRIGRKPIFIGCMIVFCIGAFVCGTSEYIVNGAGVAIGDTTNIASDYKEASEFAYIVMLAGRVLQAIGACGIIPLANAEIGTSAPPEKRGFALGITAAASGLSNVLGAGVGSAIIGIVGTSNWPVLFYACIPFGIVAIIAGAIKLPHAQGHPTGKMDITGSIVLIALIFALLLGIQFSSEGGADMIEGNSSMAMLIAFGGAFVFLVLLIALERRASDPVINPNYFKNSQILITLGVSFFIGAMINSMTLVPEFAEASLNMPIGSGGIFMMVIGIFSLAGPPVGGKLIDKYGPKPVLIAGTSIAMVGYLIIAFLTCSVPGIPTMLIGLAVMGMGLGFCMGAPVNYMILENVPDSDSNSAISAVTLVRQIGLSVAPAIYVMFITTGIGSNGYMPMFLAAAVSCAASIALMLGYKNKKM